MIKFFVDSWNGNEKISVLIIRGGILLPLLLELIPFIPMIPGLRFLIKKDATLFFLILIIITII
jgi:hypothetical protein